MKRRNVLEEIKKSSEDVGELYPVLIDEETGETLDGRTRLKANPNWRKEIVKTKTTLDRLKIKYHANWHRKDFNRQKALTEIAERTGWRGLKPFADFLGVSEQTISKYLPQKYKDTIQSERAKKLAQPPLAKKVEKAAQILEETVKAVEKSNNAEEKKQEIVGKLKVAQNSLSSIVVDNHEASIEERISQWLDDIEWEFSLWECQEERPEGFGDKTFHGNCSPTIIFALLKRYSTLSDKLIFDPMVGSGTFLDVALAVGYKKEQILARDIHPLRGDVEFGDAENTALENESVDFIFAHFPYWKLIQYSANGSDLSNLNVDEFHEKTEKIFKEMYRILKKDHYFAVMIGNLRKQGVLDLEAQFSVIGSRYFTLWDKIVKRIRTWKPETRGQRMGLAIARARQHGFSVVNHDTILVFRKS